MSQIKLGISQIGSSISVIPNRNFDLGLSCPKSNLVYPKSNLGYSQVWDIQYPKPDHVPNLLSYQTSATFDTTYIYFENNFFVNIFNNKFSFQNINFI